MVKFVRAADAFVLKKKEWTSESSADYKRIDVAIGTGRVGLVTV